MRKLYFLSLIFIPFLSISQDINNGLVGYWPFNGNANDESGNGNDGVVNGATLTEDRFGNANTAFAFDGVNDNIFIKDVQFPTNSFTYSFWFKPSDDILSRPRQDIIYGHGFARPHFTLEPSGGGVRLRFALHINGVSDNNMAFHENWESKWYYVTITWNGDVFRTYLDGILRGEFPRENAVLTESAGFYIGHRNSYPFKGKIDEFLIYNRELSYGEISLLYSLNEPLNPPICQSLYCDGENIGIGTPATHGYKLAVAGDILTEKIKVATQANWPDYVFSPEYQIPSLEELELYIQQNQKLPGIPSAQAIKEEGYNLSEMDAKLLEKIEALTLYIIELNQKIESQAQSIDHVKKENRDLRTELEYLRKN